MTREVPLTHGRFALVSDEDFVFLMKWVWGVDTHGYASRIDYSKGVKMSKRISMHRLITNAPKGMDVDHINGIRLDNRRENLRLCTRAENCRSRPQSKVRGQTGFIGVVLSSDKRRKRYQAKIKMNGRTVYLGRYFTAEEAARVRDEKAKELHGEFATLNFPGVDHG